MKSFEKEILRLRKEGLSYNQIVTELGCAKSTVSYYCGTGQKSKSKSRAFLNKEKINKRKRSRRKYLQELSQRYKRLCGCKNCKIKNPTVLQFDHIIPEDKITTISQMISDRYNIKIFKNEIRKCQILCANCHLIKTADQLNYDKF